MCSGANKKEDSVRASPGSVRVKATVVKGVHEYLHNASSLHEGDNAVHSCP